MRPSFPLPAVLAVLAASLSLLGEPASAYWVHHEAESGIVTYSPSPDQERLYVMYADGRSWYFDRPSASWHYIALFDVVDVSTLEYMGAGYFITKSGDFWYSNYDAEWIYGGNLPVSVPVDTPEPGSPVLGQNTPNPFVTQTLIRAQADQAMSGARILIFDAQGHEVRSIPVGDIQPVEIGVTWDGRDEEGHFVAEGVYFYQLVHAGGTSGTKKAVLIR